MSFDRSARGGAVGVSLSTSDATTVCRPMKPVAMDRIVSRRELLLSASRILSLVGKLASAGVLGVSRGLAACVDGGSILSKPSADALLGSMLSVLPMCEAAIGF